MHYLLDSDIVVDWLEDRAYAVQIISSLAEEGSLSISLISYGELYEGIYYSRNPEASERVFLAFLSSVNIIPIDTTVMEQFARIRGQLRATGRIIGDFDLLIAATAMQHGLTLVTRNLRHFDRIPGLVIYQTLQG